MTETVEHTGATTVHQIDVVSDSESDSVALRPVFTTVTVYPEEGNFPVVARGLLAAADHASQVRFVSHPRAGFIVPQDVFERFEATQPAATQEERAAQTAQGQPPKRRGGRPRKNIEPIKEG